MPNHLHGQIVQISMIVFERDGKLHMSWGNRCIYKQDVDLPNVILASPSMRTRETLNLVLVAWTKRISFDESKILYSKSWYDLSEEGYFNHLVHVLSEEEDITEGDESDGSSLNYIPNVDTIMIVGHNPAIEKLLNKLLLSSPNKQVKEWQLTLLDTSLL